MTILTKAIVNEAEDFLKKFKKKKFVMETKNGKIISVDSVDKEIIAHCKKLGLD